jgi:hypothetical protein
MERGARIVELRRVLLLLLLTTCGPGLFHLINSDGQLQNRLEYIHILLGIAN